MAGEYDTSRITVLGSELANVRQRPGMYVGDTGQYGAYHLLYFVLDPITEAGATRLSVELKIDGTAEIAAAGCSLDIAPLIESQRRGVISRLNDMLSVVATLSDPFFIGSDVGTPQSWSGRGGVEVADVPMAHPSGGLSVRFAPDASIFSERAYDFDLVVGRLKELAALYPGMRTHARDESTGREILMAYPDGLASLVRELGGLGAEPPLRIVGEVDGVAVEVAITMPAVSQPYPMIFSFANGVSTKGGGSHVSGLLDALTVEDDPDRARRAVAAIAVRAPREKLNFSGPTKDVLAIRGLREGVRDLVRAAVDGVEAVPPRRHP